MPPLIQLLLQLRHPKRAHKTLFLSILSGYLSRENHAHSKSPQKSLAERIELPRHHFMHTLHCGCVCLSRFAQSWTRQHFNMDGGGAQGVPPFPALLSTADRGEKLLEKKGFQWEREGGGEGEWEVCYNLKKIIKRRE